MAKKRIGLKIFMTLFLLLGAGGTVFYFGWVQLKIPAGQSAFIFTKTRGWDENIHHAGEFLWRWEAVLPTNLSIYLIPDEYIRQDFSFQGSLPSADVYQEILTGRPSFSYQFSGNFTYRLKPSTLLQLIQTEGSAYTNPNAWFDQAAQEVEAQLASGIDRFLARQEEQQGSTEISRKEVSDFLEKELATALPHLEGGVLTINRMEHPDPLLYQRARQLFLETSEARNQVLWEMEQQNLAEERQRKEKLQAMREYGEILSEYPILLEYFTMEPETPLKP